jgi:hypothetical protein
MVDIIYTGSVKQADVNWINVGILVDGAIPSPYNSTTGVVKAYDTAGTGTTPTSFVLPNFSVSANANHTYCVTLKGASANQSVGGSGISGNQQPKFGVREVRSAAGSGDLGSNGGATLSGPAWNIINAPNITAGSSTSTYKDEGSVWVQTYNQIVGSSTTASTSEFGLSTAPITASMLSTDGSCVEFTCAANRTLNGNNDQLIVRWGGIGGTQVGIGQDNNAAHNSIIVRGEVCRAGVGKQTYSAQANSGTTTNAGTAGATAGTATLDETLTQNLICTMKAGASTQGEMSFLHFKVRFAPK